MKYAFAFLALVLASSYAMAADGTVISFGPIISEIIQYVIVAFGGVIAMALTGLAVRGLKYMGLQISDAQRDRLQQIVVNGINDAAFKAEAQLKNNPRLDVDIKNQIIADAVAYTQLHGAATIKALGLDPNDGKVIEAIRARIATAIADPSQPTPPVLNPPNPQPLAPK